MFKCKIIFQWIAIIFLGASSSLFAERFRIFAVRGSFGVAHTIQGVDLEVGQVFPVFRHTDRKSKEIGKIEIAKMGNDRIAVKFIPTKEDFKIQVNDYFNAVGINNDENILDEILCADIVESSSSEKMVKSKTNLESWYSYWAIGYSGISYPPEIDELFSDVKNLSGVIHSSISIDMLGFYWPSSPNTIFGGVINGWADRYELNGDYLQLNGYLYSLSMMHFFNNHIGDGFFVRCDAGGARLLLQAADSREEVSDWGYGGLVGCGIGIPIGRGTRLLLNINYSYRHIADNNYGAFHICLGGLF